jgi:Fe-S-cluster-containing dehydrogenase component/anaerobic selenocysteine-containing dehydrogenase
MKAGEFPAGAAEWPDDLSRRDFLRLTGASLALAGLGACTKQPIEKIVPYVKQPEEMVPGKPLFFASSTAFNGYAQGVVIKSREGRPIKIEGNPDHPASRGATTIWAQADLLDLYDPDRAQSVRRGENISTWDDFLQEIDLALNAQQAKGGSGLRILLEPSTSPTLNAQLQTVLRKFPAARIYTWNPIAPNDSWMQYDLASVQVIVALDCDFLFIHPGALRYARDFAAGRRLPNSGNPVLNRLYVAEPTPTITGSNADHRLAAAAGDMAAIAEALAARIAGRSQTAVSNYQNWIEAAAADLIAAGRSGLVIGGKGQPDEVQALLQEINHRIGAKTAPAPRFSREPLRNLVDEMSRGAVELLIIIGGNPVYDAPVDFGFADALAKVKTSVHHTLYANETSAKCPWLIPATHLLESWSDATAFEGSLSIIQPLIEPLYANVSVHQLIAAVTERPVPSTYDIVRQTWQGQPMLSSDNDWRRAVSDGVFRPQPNEPITQEKENPSAPYRTEPLTLGSGELEIVFRPDPSVLDGRYANNGWLQELPRPFTKLTWGNAALISPELAAREKITNGDMVELTFRGRKLNAPIWIQPGQAENSITVHLGYGRTEVGQVGRGAGFNAYTLRTSDALSFGRGLTIRKTGYKYSFATTQKHHAMEGRDFLRSGTLAQFTADHRAIAKSEDEPARDETLYHPSEFENRGYAWGMVIDLGTCIGCSSCTIACQAENNIPVVGKEQVMRGREMHWIRIDTYEAGPRFEHQPVPCMHCEHAPCELVCPVGATVHDAEGLNLQVYNRCVGTRYCSNNCPYKVRRFNFLELNGALSPTEKLVKNPEVTVRSRGVMEKCTYCLQRINAAHVNAELENRQIRDGEIIPACVQVCPTEAIIFGNIHDPNSRVSQLKRSPLNYGMLAELNTRPRTTYLAKIRNPNPNLPDA